MPGLDPGIMQRVSEHQPYDLWSGIMDRRVKPGDDAANCGEEVRDRHFQSILVIS